MPNCSHPQLIPFLKMLLIPSLVKTIASKDLHKYLSWYFTLKTLTFIGKLYLLNSLFVGVLRPFNHFVAILHILMAPIVYFHPPIN